MKSRLFSCPLDYPSVITRDKSRSPGKKRFIEILMIMDVFEEQPYYRPSFSSDSRRGSGKNVNYKSPSLRAIEKVNGNKKKDFFGYGSPKAMRYPPSFGAWIPPVPTSR